MAVVTELIEVLSKPLECHFELSGEGSNCRSRLYKDMLKILKLKALF